MKANKNWFSNFLPFDKPLIHRNISYPTVEHFFQALKTTDMKTRDQIASCSTPAQAKKLGRKVKLRPGWDRLKMQYMERALKYKFRKGTLWHDKLIISKGDLIEWNHWHDNYWGNCICSQCLGLSSKNMLGILLMKLRNRLIRR